MLTYSQNGSLFARYVQEYNRSPNEWDRTLIHLMVEVGDEMTVAILDSGMPYSICSPAWAEYRGYTIMNADTTDPIRVNGRLIEGRTHLIPIRILPDLTDDDDYEPELETITIHAFVPNRADELPASPLRLGLVGCLSSINFAVHGNRHHFYWM